MPPSVSDQDGSDCVAGVSRFPVCWNSGQRWLLGETPTSRGTVLL